MKNLKTFEEFINETNYGFEIVDDIDDLEIDSTYFISTDIKKNKFNNALPYEYKAPQNGKYWFKDTTIPNTRDNEIDHNDIVFTKDELIKALDMGKINIQIKK